MVSNHGILVKERSSNMAIAVILPYSEFLEVE